MLGFISFFFFSPNLYFLLLWSTFSFLFRLSIATVCPLTGSVPHFLFSWCLSVCLFRTFLLQTVLSLSIPSQPSPIWDQCTPHLSLRWPSARTHICVCLLSVFRGPLNSALAGPDTLTSPLRPTERRKVIRFPYPCQTHIHRHASVEVACSCEWSSLLSLPNIKAWNQTKFPQQPLGLWDGHEANASGHWPDSVPTSCKSGAGLGCRGAPLKTGYATTVPSAGQWEKLKCAGRTL